MDAGVVALLSVLAFVSGIGIGAWLMGVGEATGRADPHHPDD